MRNVGKRLKVNGDNGSEEREADFMLPFTIGWKREIVRNDVTGEYTIYYIDPVRKQKIDSCDALATHSKY